MNETTKEKNNPGAPLVTSTSSPSSPNVRTIPSRTETLGTSSEQSHTAAHTEGVRSQPPEFATQLAEKAGETRRQVGEHIDTLVEQGRQRAEALGEAASSAVDRLNEAGAYLQEANFDEMVQDLITLVRRYPLQSILIGLGIGYLFARNRER